ncbi:helix-turn-helix transcriptional regulator [Cyanobium sp. N.Huapi 1H5]|nr:helix-turn-helix transcriptional regulator [Cyanobium sp. N.Huapi 1H5]
MQRGPAVAEAFPVAITPAEQRVLDLLLRGDSNRLIAAQLVLSPRTVESHVSHLLAKTGCRSRTQLLLWALAQG